jgi:hypothetical protein
VPGFDAELYLRLLGEQLLVDREDQHRGARRPAIAEAAAALVAVAAIAPDRAERALDEYRLAATLRNDPRFRHAMMVASQQTTRGVPKPLAPRRVVPCAQTIERPQAIVQVRYVSLSEEETAVAVTLYPHSSRPWLGAPPSMTLTDDRGASEAARFSGSGSSSEGMNGRLTPARPLAPDTAWIELDGVRLELSGRVARFDASLERLPEQDPAARYLWQQLSEPSDFHATNIEPAIEALIAARAIAADDPLLDDVRMVLEATQARGPYGAGGPPPGRGPVPEPWLSLLARQGREDGPTGSIVLGAVTPVFDGFSVGVLEVQSDEYRFRADVEVAPGAAHRMPFDWGMRPHELAWWAKDDRGNHYLGRRGNWNFSGDYSTGLIEFQSALDPAATRLELMPSAETTRAVISFALPWGRENPGGRGSGPQAP